MLNSDMIKGILLSLGKVDFHIERSDDSAIGYRTRLRLNVRAESLDFIEELHRGLLRMGVESTVKDKEHSGRPKPILRIGELRICIFLLKQSLMNCQMLRMNGLDSDKRLILSQTEITLQKKECKNYLELREYCNGTNLYQKCKTNLNYRKTRNR